MFCFERMLSYLRRVDQLTTVWPIAMCPQQHLTKLGDVAVVLADFRAVLRLMVMAVIWRHLINKILFLLNKIKQHYPPLVSFVSGGSEDIDDINGIAVSSVMRRDTFTSEM